MPQTKVKIFQHVTSISPGNTGSGKGYQKLEEEINSFLRDNTSAKPVDVKITSHAAPVGELVTNYAIIALLIYEDG